MELNYKEGINIPLLASDMSTNVLSPSAITPFYAFNSTYYQVTILENGNSYWTKFNGNQSVTITGTIVSTNSINVNEGWNLIGPFGEEILVASITTVPPNIIASPLFGFSNGYTQTSILPPGKGYWIKVNSVGTIILNTAR